MPDIIMHRTRNLGVTGVKGKFTTGPAINRDKMTGVTRSNRGSKQSNKRK